MFVCDVAKGLEAHTHGHRDKAADSVVKCRFSCAVFAAPNRRAARRVGASGTFTDKHKAE